MKRIYLVPFTQAEIKAVLGVSGDVDPAHFEYRGKAYEAAFSSADRKLRAATSSLATAIRSAFKRAQIAVTAPAEIEASERRTGLGRKAQTALDKAEAMLAKASGERP